MGSCSMNGGIPLDQVWFVLQTKPKAEETAAGNLKRLGVEFYLPQLSIGHNREHHRKIAPLFPSYLFITERSAKPCFYSLDFIPGTLRLLRQGDNTKDVARVSSPVITKIRALEEMLANEPEPEPEKTFFKPDDIVVICNGPLQSLTARVIRMSGHDRVILLFHMLGTAEIELDIDAVQKIA